MNLLPVIDDAVVRVALLITLIWAGRLDGRIKKLERTSDAQTKAIGRLHRQMVAHERYMRSCVRDFLVWQGSHEHVMKKLARVAHSHEEMHPPKDVCVTIDRRDTP